MKLLTYAALFLILLFGSVCQAQDKAALTQLLKSEAAATALIAELNAYDAKSPWDSDTIWSVAQKLAVKGLVAKEIERTIVGSGEAAAALDGNDRLFAAIALTVGGIYKEKRPGPSLYVLEGLGVPAFDLLGEILEKSPKEVREYADADRLRSEPIAALLTESCRRRYHGMSEQLLLKLQTRP